MSIQQLLGTIKALGLGLAIALLCFSSEGLFGQMPFRQAPPKTPPPVVLPGPGQIQMLNNGSLYSFGPNPQFGHPGQLQFAFIAVASQDCRLYHNGATIMPEYRLMSSLCLDSRITPVQLQPTQGYYPMLPKGGLIAGGGGGGAGGGAAGGPGGNQGGGPAMMGWGGYRMPYYPAAYGYNYPYYPGSYESPSYSGFDFSSNPPTTSGSFSNFTGTNSFTGIGSFGGNNGNPFASFEKKEATDNDNADNAPPAKKDADDQRKKELIRKDESPPRN